jgi:tetratricopeptide (TPR) repeat protein
MDQFGMGNYDAATRYFERAITLDSTFALPYMRIGMAHAFQQHPQEASRYISKALQYQSKLPVRERSLLDIYADIWLNRKFDDAFTKMRSMVSNYPDDIEARTVYGILVLQFTRDSSKAFAQLDTVLSYNPTYQLPLEFRAEAYLNYGMYDQAIKLAEEIKLAHPASPGSYMLLGSAYLRQGKRDKAEKEFHDLLARYPTNETALGFLIRLAIYKRDFALAQQLTEKYTQIEPGNLYNKVDYYDQMSGLMFWQGKFKEALRQYDLMLQTAAQLDDSSILANSYQSAAVGYLQCGLDDSGLTLYRRAYDFRTANMFSNYSLALVGHDRQLADSARRLFERDIAAFKARIPSELWGITEGLEKIFEGMAAADSSLLLDGYRTIIKTQGERITANHREMAYILIRRGQYQDGIDILKRLVSGEEESAGGIGYPMALYYLGMGYEGLGDRAEAKKYYSEMLTYWGNADIQFKEIKDARERLAKLTS